MAPSQEEVLDLFSQLAKQETQKNFFAQVRDDVNWWIVGSTPMSRTYTSKQDFQNATLEILNKKVLGQPLCMRVVNVVAGKDQAVGELEAIDATCRNGLEYPMRYCWVLHFDDDGKIDRVRAYLDTELLSKAIAQNS
ncbi:hypothetical protein LTR05_003725 [Lithohypha guttulata]|uniref:SnoaL-like domain-containing protein n=1 Tax=Lithohypha guttulata TaxID=1690604 RepID=A0AAN7T079_9EURO|nr:hypothetical protein LTR05_003725 [Lithohypha guttulata]